MNYEKIYKDFITSRKNISYDNDEYTENHHILPKSIGGDNNSYNIIKLSYRDHLFAHMLLYKMQTNVDSKYRMAKALDSMVVDSRNNRTICSRQYDKIKKMSKIAIRAYYATPEGKEMAVKRAQKSIDKRVNKEVFKFYHPEFGVFEGNCYELTCKFPDEKLSSTNLIKVGNKLRGRHKGWALYENRDIDWTSETKLKQSLARIGVEPWNKGLTYKIKKGDYEK